MHFLIVDDHPLYREALRTTVLLAYPDTSVEEADSIAAACASCCTTPATSTSSCSTSRCATSAASTV